MAAASGGSASLLDGSNSVDLTQKKRKLSESSDTDPNESMNKKYKNDQFDFLYNYFIQNEPNEELRKQDKSSMDFDMLFQYYQMSELTKKGGRLFGASQLRTLTRAKRACRITHIAKMCPNCPALYRAK